jgi:PiT family inorganic phosphate transporter/sulfate permease
MIVGVVGLAAFFAMLLMGLNIGGNNAAASMGAAYGAGARTKMQAVALIGVFSLLGAVLSGGEVIKTLGGGLVPSELITLVGAVVIVFLAAVTIFVANIVKVPISTSQAAVGAVVGYGLFVNTASVNAHKLAVIAGWWVVTPVVAWSLAYLVGKYFYPSLVMWLADHKSEAAIRRGLNASLTISGCYVAYSAGANNAANAVGPFVGAGLLTNFQGEVLGGLTIGLGALVLGGRVLDTVGKDIAELCVMRAVFVEFIAAGLVHLASELGIPISLGEIVTAGVIGIGCASTGMHIAKSDTVKKIALMWVLSPLLAGVSTYLGMKLMSALALI